MRFISKPRSRAGVAVLAASSLAAFGLIGVAAFAAPLTSRAERVSKGAVRIQQSRGGGWVGTWAASPQAANPEESPLSVSGFSDQTVRNIVYAAVGGSEIRVRF